MESKFHELKNRLLKNIDQTSESRLYMDIQLAQNCETLMSIIKKGYRISGKGRYPFPRHSRRF